MNKLKYPITIKSDYENGLTIRQIAEKYDMNRETIRKRLHKLDVKMRENWILSNNEKSKKTRKLKKFGGQFKDVVELEIWIQENTIKRRYL